MFIDAQNLFSDAQAVTATAASTNLIDLGVDGNLGVGEPMCVVVVVDVALDNTTTDETYVVSIETDDNASFSSAATIASRTLAAGSAAGSKFVIGVPADASAERYIRLKYTHGGTTPTGTYTAFLTAQKNVQNDFYYANGYTIS